MDAKSDSAPIEEEIEDVPGKEPGDLCLPLARVRRLVKMDPEVKLIAGDAVFLITKATELFIAALAHDAHTTTKTQARGTLTYADLGDR